MIITLFNSILELENNLKYAIIFLQLQVVDLKLDIFINFCIVLKLIIEKYDLYCSIIINLKVSLFDLLVNFSFFFFLNLTPFIVVIQTIVGSFFKIYHNLFFFSFLVFLSITKFKTNIFVCLYVSLYFFMEEYNFNCLNLMFVMVKFFDLKVKLFFLAYLHLTSYVSATIVFILNTKNNILYGVVFSELVALASKKHANILLTNTIFYLQITKFRLELLYPFYLILNPYISLILNNYLYQIIMLDLKIIKFKLELLLPFYLLLKPFISLIFKYILNNFGCNVICLQMQILKFKLDLFLPFYLLLKPFIDLIFKFILNNFGCNIICIQMQILKFRAELLFPFYLFLKPFINFSFEFILDNIRCEAILLRLRILKFKLELFLPFYLILNPYIQIGILHFVNIFYQLQMLTLGLKLFFGFAFNLKYCVKAIINMQNSFKYGIISSSLMYAVLEIQNNFKYGVINSAIINIVLTAKNNILFYIILLQLNLMKLKAGLNLFLYFFFKSVTKKYNLACLKLIYVQVISFKLLVKYRALPIKLLWYFIWSRIYPLFLYFFSIVTPFSLNFTCVFISIWGVFNSISFVFSALKAKLVLKVILKIVLIYIKFKWVYILFKFEVFYFFSYKLHILVTAANIFFSSLSFALFYYFLIKFLYGTKTFLITFFYKLIHLSFLSWMFFYSSIKLHSYLFLFYFKLFSIFPGLVFVCFFLEFFYICFWLMSILIYLIKHTVIPRFIVLFFKRLFLKLNVYFSLPGINLKIKAKFLIIKLKYSIIYFEDYFSYFFTEYTDHFSWYIAIQWFYFHKMIYFIYGPRFKYLFLFYFLHHFYCNSLDYPLNKSKICQFFFECLKKGFVRSFVICVCAETIITFAFEIAHIIVFIFFMPYTLLFLTSLLVNKYIKVPLKVLYYSTSPYDFLFVIFFSAILLNKYNLLNNYLFFVVYRILKTFGEEWCQTYYPQKYKIYLIYYYKTPCIYLANDKIIAAKITFLLVGWRFLHYSVVRASCTKKNLKSSFICEYRSDYYRIKYSVKITSRGGTY